jgi:phosphatidylserine decarboxylase precursor-related protein
VPVISSYGKGTALPLLLVSAGIALGGSFLQPPVLAWVSAGLGAALAVLTLWFFRDPERPLPPECRVPGAVVSPADGRIVAVATEPWAPYVEEEVVRISIFLSLLDVHVNRVPASGIVQYYRYLPGNFLAAYRAEASQRNEQTHIGVQTPCGRLLFKQIAGVLARRIVCTLHEGQHVQAGERFGMMKFGSRMDILLPRRQARVFVHIGMRVRAGQTLLAHLCPEHG